MNTKELNEKLLKFAGIEYLTYEYKFGGAGMPYSGWYLNGKRIRQTAPDLVHDANAQIKYLYSAIKNLPESRFGDTSFGIEWQSETNNYFAYIKIFNEYNAFDENPAIAFALACEKYIDGLIKKG